MKTPIAFFVILFFPFATTSAQWSQDPAVNMVLDKPGDQRAPLLTSDGKGGAIVAWNEDSGVFANWVNRHGFRQWGREGVRVTPPSRIGALTNVISDGHGGAVIVWEDLTNARQVGSEVIRIIENEMFAQRIDSLGQPVWDPEGIGIRTKIDTTTIGAFGLVSSDFSEFIMFWTDDRRWVLSDNSTKRDFYAQKVDLQGNVLWETNGQLITGDDGLNNTRRRLVADNAGGFLLARFGEGNQNTVVERISSDGELLWQPGGISVNTGGGFDLDSDQQKGAVIAGVFFPGGGFVGEVRVQRVSHTGELLWTDSAKVIMEEIDIRTSPRIVSDLNSGAFIFWNSNDEGGNRQGFLHHVDSAGNADFPALATRFNQASTIHPIFFADSQGDAILLANDYATPEGDFWAIKIGRDGNLVWGNEGEGTLFRLRPFNDWPFYFDAIPDGSGGFIACWEEFLSTTNYDIVMQQVSTNGILGETITSVRNIPGQNIIDDYMLLQNYPNPFNPTTTIRFGLKKKGNVMLKIYDLNGKEVITLLDREMAAGEHSVDWNGKDYAGYSVASGIYFYRLQINGIDKVRKLALIR